MLVGGGIQGMGDKGEKKRDNYNSIINRIYLKIKLINLWELVLCAGPHSPLAFLSGSWAHATQNNLLYFPLCF